MDIGSRIKYLRISSGKTQAIVAKNIGITTASLSAIENSLTKSPKPENVLKIADFFNVSIHWLISGNGPKTSGQESKNSEKNSSTLSLSPEEMAMLLKFRQLEDNQKKATQTMLDAMAQPGKEMKRANS